MGLTAIRFDVELVVQTCCVCGIQFAFPTHWNTRRREDHATWYCPNGHSQSYLIESEVEKERRKSAMLADQVRMEREQREKAERQLKRVNRGVCPKCNRTFAELARHMQNRHGVECKKPPKGSKVRG